MRSAGIVCKVLKCPNSKTKNFVEIVKDFDSSKMGQLILQNLRSLSSYLCFKAFSSETRDGGKKLQYRFRIRRKWNFRNGFSAA